MGLQTGQRPAGGIPICWDFVFCAKSLSLHGLIIHKNATDMKKFLLLAATLLIAGMANAKVVEKTYTVRGHCGMCKNRIETVAKGFEGVQSAAYDLKAQSLKLTYETRQVKPNKVLKAIAAIGYDAGKFTAPQEAYDRLEACCRYREIEGVNDHEHGEGHQHGAE